MFPKPDLAAPHPAVRAHYDVRPPAVACEPWRGHWRVTDDVCLRTRSFYIPAALSNIAATSIGPAPGDDAVHVLHDFVQLRAQLPAATLLSL